MGDKDKKALMTIQPNNVTFGQYEISSIQENIITAISDFLQPRMTNKEGLITQLLSSDTLKTDMDIHIDCNEVGGKNNKLRVTKEAKALMDKKFTFRWVVPGTKQNVETTGVVVTTVHDFKGSSKLTVSVNKWAIPYLIYYGKGVGGTVFSKKIALTLRGKYAKRIYKIICSQRDRSVFEYSIKQFRADFEVPKNYDNAHIKSKILEPAKKAIDSSHSDVTFDYEFVTKKRNQKTKPVADTIVLHITPVCVPVPVSEDMQKELANNYNYCYTWMKRVSGIENDPDIIKCTEGVENSGKMAQFIKKLEYYDDQLASGNCAMLYVRNTIAKILREDYGLTIVVHKI